MTTRQVYEAIGTMEREAIAAEARPGIKSLGIAEGFRRAKEILITAQLEADAELNAKYKGIKL